MRRVTPAAHGEIACLGQLATGAPGTRSDISEGVPAFRDHDRPPTLVDEPDVDGPRGLCRARRQLESAAEASPARGRENELLDREMCRVRGVGERIATERDPQRHPDGDRQPLPRIDRHRGAETALRPAYGGLAHAGPRPEVLLGDATAHPRRPQLRAETGELLLVALRGGALESCAMAGRHVAGIVANGAYLAPSCERDRLRT